MSSRPVDSFVRSAYNLDVNSVNNYLRRYPHLINEPNHVGRTALSTVLGKNPSDAKTHIVYLLLSHGADFNKPDSGTLTPLMQAVYKNDIPVTILLLQAGVNLTGFQNNEGQTYYDLIQSREMQQLLHNYAYFGIIPEDVASQFI